MTTLKLVIGATCLVCAVCSMLTGSYFVGVVGIIIGGMLVLGK